VITIHQRYRQTDEQTDRQTTCVRNTALCTKVHRAVKTVEVRIIKFSPYGSPSLEGYVSSRKSRVPPQRGASNKGVGKMSSFLSLSVNISKTVADTAEVTIND